MTAFSAPKSNEAASKLINNLSSKLKVSAQQLQPFTRFQEDLLLDKFDLDMLVAHLENCHSHFLTEEEAENIETVGDLQRIFSQQAA